MAHRTPTEIEQKVVEAYQRSPRGGHTLAAQCGVTATTLYRILRRHGVLIAEEKRHGRTVRRFRLSKTEQLEVCRLMATGEANSVALARRFGVSRDTIFEACKRHGVKPRQGRPLLEAEPETLAQVIAWYREGASQEAIAKRVDVHQGTVSRWLRQAGVPTLPRPSHKRHGSFKGGVVGMPGGYVGVLLPPGHPMKPMANGSGYVLQHRLVMAEHLGRPLMRTETVHHVNGDKTDNRITNLELRFGKHGKGVALCCADCGSRNIVPIGLSRPVSTER